MTGPITLSLFASDTAETGLCWICFGKELFKRRDLNVVILRFRASLPFDSELPSVEIPSFLVIIRSVLRLLL
ncbi:hypothetical protein P8452_48005 [Trifolium repens]|nr:hypothetical protein P8452_48005 [Trifolium repens]